jgi:hypothetical protein
MGVVRSLDAAMRLEYSLWIVDSNDSCEEMRDGFSDYVDADEKLIVMRRVVGFPGKELPRDISQRLMEHPA